jgi:hypothetical protein
MKGRMNDQGSFGKNEIVMDDIYIFADQRDGDN